MSNTRGIISIKAFWLNCTIVYRCSISPQTACTFRYLFPWSNLSFLSCFYFFTMEKLFPASATHIFWKFTLTVVLLWCRTYSWTRRSCPGWASHRSIKNQKEGSYPPKCLPGLPGGSRTHPMKARHLWRLLQYFMRIKIGDSRLWNKCLPWKWKKIWVWLILFTKPSSS